MSNASDYAKHYMENYIETGSKDYSLSEWLYGDWDKQKYQRYLKMDSVPYLHQRMDYLLSLRSDQEYLSANGMSYSDIHDPRKLPSHNAAVSYYGSILNFVSSNINRLY